jgi:hypothetical protein
VAERAGFEPAVGFDPYAALAKRCFRPLSHLSGTRHHTPHSGPWQRRRFLLASAAAIPDNHPARRRPPIPGIPCNGFAPAVPIEVREPRMADARPSPDWERDRNYLPSPSSQGDVSALYVRFYSGGLGRRGRPQHLPSHDLAAAEPGSYGPCLMQSRQCPDQPWADSRFRQVMRVAARFDELWVR